MADSALKYHGIGGLKRLSKADIIDILRNSL
jgi:hypothetical protein